jgi:hypothetical protein
MPENQNIKLLSLRFPPNRYHSSHPNISLGEHAGSPLQPLNTRGFVGADLRVSPIFNGIACVSARYDMALIL